MLADESTDHRKGTAMSTGLAWANATLAFAHNTTFTDISGNL